MNELRNLGRDRSHVKVFSGVTPRIRTDASFLASFVAFDPSFRGGVDVAVGDIENESFAEITTGRGPKTVEDRPWTPADVAAFPIEFRGFLRSLSR
jgi:hypothetical protein